MSEALDRLQHDISDMRTDIRSLRKSVGHIEGILDRQQSDRRLNRSTLWFGVFLAAAFGLLFAALHYWPPGHG